MMNYKKNIKIWEKVENVIRKELDIEPVYNEKYRKAKIKSHNGKINTNFNNNKIPKEGFPIYLFISNFDRFCFSNRQKLLSSSAFRRM